MAEMKASGGSRRALPGSVSFVPSVAGLMIGGYVIRDLTGLL
jgi:tRNA A37 threonylcarbamoyladenosine dehydratase